MRTAPDLMFLASSDSAGFTPAGVTSFREISPSAIVRELIQNSLDAAQAARQPKAVIRFRLGRIHTSEIPGIESYRRAFERAQRRRRDETGGDLSDQEQMIIDRIQNALTRSTQNLLTVIDNGIGLDCNTMKALLSDGISRKSSGASGAFGNGHLTVFPTSDLQYVLYGGVNNGRWISSGHAILASHDEGENDPIGRSAHGYYLAHRDGRHRRYPDQSGTPSIIADVLREVADTTTHGTAVIVPAFNCFREDEDVLKAIRMAASCSFFPAIHGKELEIVVEDRRQGNGEAPVVIDGNNLHATLLDFQGQKANKNFLSGVKANSAYETIMRGSERKVPVLDGQVCLHLLKPAPSGRTRINLCRNGMWITNSDTSSGGIPGFYGKFGDRESFEVLILVSSRGARQFHNLIRKAEGPLHNRLDAKSLSKDDARELRGAFGEIKEWLRAHVDEITSDAFSPPDFLGFAADSAGTGGSQMPGYRFAGKLTPIPRQSSAPKRNVDGSGGVRARPFGRGKDTGRRKDTVRQGARRRPTLPPYFTAVAIPQGSERRKIVIQCTEDTSNLELRLFVNENTDPTTDRIWNEETVPITKATINGRPTAENDIVGGERPGLRLGDLKAGSKTEVVMEYKLDGRGFRGHQNAACGLRVEIGKLPEEISET